jgi:hypothetical protein
LSKAYLWARAVRKAKMALVNEAVLMRSGPLMCPALTSAVSEGAVPSPSERVLVYPILFLVEVVRTKVRPQTTRHTVLITGAAFIVQRASVAGSKFSICTGEQIQFFLIVPLAYLRYVG